MVKVENKTINMEGSKKTLIIGINLSDSGSTGNIMRNSLEFASKNGNYDYFVIVPKDLGRPNTYGYKDKKLNIIQKVIFHRILNQSQNNPDGFYETPYTKRIVKKIKKISKSYSNVFVHLHNIHMASIDLRILFNYLKRGKKISKVFYTLHDVWPMTGGCYCFNYNKCVGWKEERCKSCRFNGVDFNTKKISPHKVYELKQKYMILLKEKLVLITVSNWIMKMVNQSFLKECKRVINYGECSMTANPIITEDIKANHNLKSKKIVLTVSAYWNDWKGYKYIYEIAKKLPEDYVVMVIGGKFDTGNFKNIIHIKSVPNEDLHNYYSAADVYVSTSQDESLGLTTCEAQLCGTPIVCFGHGAIKETVTEKSGIIVGEENDVNKMVKAIKYIAEKKPFNKGDIISSGKRFQKFEHARRMLEIYNQKD